jgi:hypothetical protein
MLANSKIRVIIRRAHVSQLKAFVRILYTDCMKIYLHICLVCDPPGVELTKQRPFLDTWTPKHRPQMEVGAPERHS